MLFSNYQTIDSQSTMVAKIKDHQDDEHQEIDMISVPNAVIEIRTVMIEPKSIEFPATHLSTHLLQILQCLLLGVLMILHSGHKL